MDMTPAEMVKNYIRLRDYKKKADEEFKKSMEKVNAGMEVLENRMLAYLNETGADRIGCPEGTVYRNTQYSATVQDRTAFLDWVQVSGEWEALDVRANKTVIRALADEGTLPPGVSFTAVHTVGVQRAKA